MHHSIRFSQVTVIEYDALKAKYIFSEIGPPGFADSGEKIFKGTSPSDECYLFSYYAPGENISFLILNGGKQVYYHFTEAASAETIQSLIRGNINKFCLQEQGNFCLHAAGIITGDRVILFIGQKGAGKSTLATWFHLQGHPVWCDDYGVLERSGNGFLAYQGETSLKINPDTAAKLDIPSQKLQSVFTHPAHKLQHDQSRHIEGKYYFSDGVQLHTDNPLPLAAMCVMEPREMHPEQIVGVKDKSAAFKVLMTEMLLPGINSKDYLKQYFQSCKTLLDVVPVYEIHSPDDISRINEVYDAILKSINSEYAAG